MTSVLYEVFCNETSANPGPSLCVLGVSAISALTFVVPT